MTASRTTNIINEAYGYPIIGDAEESSLQADSEIIMSELGIGNIFEFLSYDVSEFSEARKTIHARRFYQLYKDVFSFTGFNMEAFHKIQAGCIFIVALSGITRGISDYEYSGFVKDALVKIGKVDSDEDRQSTLNEKLFYIRRTFEKFSRISLGIYSLQIFTKYGMVIQNINRVLEGTAGRLLVEIIGEMNMEKHASPVIDRLLALDIVKPEKLESMIDEYINYAVADITVQNASPGSRKAERENKKMTDEISVEVHDAFLGLKMDIADLHSFNKDMIKKKLIYDREYEKKGVSIMFASLLERYVSQYERLVYYESNSFIKRLNMIFISRVKEMFSTQRKQELNIIRNECIRIIEEGLPGFTVYELEGVLNALEIGKKEFDIRHAFASSDSESVFNELDAYLEANLKTAASIQNEMRNNLGRILGPNRIPEEEKKILQEIVYDFDAIMDLLTEDEQ